LAAKKSASKKTATKKKATRRKQVAPASRGLSPQQAHEPESDATALLEAKVRSAGGTLVGAYRDPLGGQALVLALLPVDQIIPTPFQRDLSDAHVKRLEGVIDKVDVFLDPVIAVVAPYGADAPFWTPNGLHRLSALKRLGAKTVTALVSADPALAYRILALNTEKAHNTKERALEAVRMARGLAEVDPKRRESEFALEFEEGSLVTLGMAYEKRPRFAGGAYAPARKASDEFLEEPLEQALAIREERAERLLAIDERVTEIMEGLKERGFDSPYLRNFVVARIRPFRPRGKPAPDADALLDHMEQAAEKFDVGKVKESQVAKTAGAGE
jgi:ParB family chromosome partitioning protein